MDAAALLRAQGWRGHGHTLHPTDNAVGLARPLLLRRNTDGRGVGQAAAHYTSDQWWLRAFDEKLKGLSTTTAPAGPEKKAGERVMMVQTVAAGRLDAVALGAKNAGKYGSLYANFVRGEGMEGTITPASETEATETTTGSADETGVGETEGGEEGTGATTPLTSEDGEKKNVANRAAAAVAAISTRGNLVAARKRGEEKGWEQREKSRKEGSETKQERRVRREARRIRKAEKEKKKLGQKAFGEAGAEEAKRTAAVVEKKASRMREKMSETSSAEGETREERRARRAARRVRKEERRRRKFKT